MDKKAVVFLILFLASLAYAQTQEQETIGKWNQVLCITFKALQILSALIGIIALIYAGMKYMTSQEDPEARSEARKLIIQVIVGVLFITVAAELVNYLVTGTDIKPFDTACQ